MKRDTGSEPRTEWQALIDDLHAEFDQGHLAVYRIVDKHRATIEAEAARAADDRLREALRVVIDKHDAYLAAQNGDGHPDQSHDRELAHLTAAPGEYVSTVDGCAGCGGAQYGSESDFNDAIDAARALLSAPSPVRESEGLDVRRVVKAIENVAARHGIKKDPPAPLSLARIYGYSTTIPDMDAQIAAEYAHLTPERPADEVDG